MANGFKLSKKMIFYVVGVLVLLLLLFSMGFFANNVLEQFAQVNSTSNSTYSNVNSVKNLEKTSNTRPSLATFSAATVSPTTVSPTTVSAYTTTPSIATTTSLATVSAATPFLATASIATTTPSAYATPSAYSSLLD